MFSGVARRANFEGLLTLTVNTDLQKLIGWANGRAEVAAFQIHNAGHTVDDGTGSIADPSSIDAVPTSRLFTAWVEQNFGGMASLRVGQLAADSEFLLIPA